jgi:hypothetical protein
MLEYAVKFYGPRASKGPGRPAGKLGQVGCTRLYSATGRPRLGRLGVTVPHSAALPLLTAAGKAADKVALLDAAPKQVANQLQKPRPEIGT